MFFQYGFSNVSYISLNLAMVAKQNMINFVLFRQTYFQLNLSAILSIHIFSNKLLMMDCVEFKSSSSGL